MDKDTKNIVANRLRTLRLQNGLSQKVVAQQLSVDTSTISYYENGKRSVPADILKRITRIYGTTVDEILGDVRYEAKEEWMTVEKTPLPAFIKDYRLNIALMGAFVLLFMGVMFVESALLALAGIIMILHGVFWINHVFFVFPKEAKYYAYSKDSIPRFSYEENLEYKRNDLKSLLFLSVFGFMGLFLISGLMLVSGEQGVLSATDEAIVVYLFLVNTGFLFYTITKIVRGTLLVNEFKEHEKDRRMDTLKFGIFKLFIFLFYLLAMLNLHYLNVVKASISFSPVFYFALIQVVFISLYLIPTIILAKFRHYKLYK